MTAAAPPLATSSTGARSLPELLLAQADHRPRAVAMRQKQLGIWREISWEEYSARAAHIGLGLLELGVLTGDRVALHSSNRCEWLLADAGIQGLGAVTVGVYPTNPPAEVEYLLRHSESVLLFAENEEQLDKALAVRDRLPNLRKIVVFDTRGIRDLGDEMLMSLDELEARGRQHSTDQWRRRAGQLDPHETATIVYTSGTTGPPKGAMLAHADLVAAGRSFVEAVGADHRDEVFSYYPLSHVTERLVSSAGALTAGYLVGFGEGADSFELDITEAQPTVFLGVPRVWERMAAMVEKKIADTSWLKRTAYTWATRRGAKAAARRRQGSGGGAGGVLASVVALRSLRATLGLGRVRVAISGAAPIAAPLLERLWTFGIPVREVYGLTESAGGGAINPADDVRLGTVGTASPGMELRLLDDGEIALRGPSVFQGYFRNDDATKSARDADGWLHTGDLGELADDGYLTITGRKKDIIITSGGKNIAPAGIEKLLESSPLVERAIVFGDGRDYLTALIGIDPRVVADWAARRRLTFTTYAELAGHSEVRELVREVVDGVNAQLASIEQVRHFELLPVQLDEEDGQLTATEKVKRAAVAEEFAALVEGMYERGPEQ